ncbi:hypothetical protein [Methylocapsa sp. S129]|uniref:hypothetical protein n=1 Tax=Methylocapsa sp. S129 TaxID=1641869 RepID=UPI00131E83F7|nr:hypothetical protein [Methylocapsa sp. S129]
MSLLLLEKATVNAARGGSQFLDSLRAFAAACGAGILAPPASSASTRKMRSADRSISSFRLQSSNSPDLMA